MRQVRFYEYGDPDVLRVEDAPEPVPGDGEPVVRATAIGVTLPSVRMVRGSGPLPGVLGGEVAGEVVALGPGVSGFAVGDRVVSLPFTGSYAELVVTPAVMTTHIPPGGDDATAVALVRSGHVALAGRLRPAIHTELPLTRAAEAHRILEARENLGKVVLRP